MRTRFALLLAAGFVIGCEPRPAAIREAQASELEQELAALREAETVRTAGLRYCLGLRNSLRALGASGLAFEEARRERLAALSEHRQIVQTRGSERQREALTIIEGLIEYAGKGFASEGAGAQKWPDARRNEQLGIAPDADPPRVVQALGDVVADAMAVFVD